MEPALRVLVIMQHIVVLKVYTMPLHSIRIAVLEKDKTLGIGLVHINNYLLFMILEPIKVLAVILLMHHQIRIMLFFFL